MIQTHLVGLLTLTRKELTRVFRIWTQTILPSVITTTLYFLIFGSFIGNRIGEFQGVAYMEFIVPGLIMMSVISTSYSNVASSVFSSKFHKNIEELLISPLANWAILLGYASGGIIRGCIVGLLVSTVAYTFAPITPHSIGLVIVTMILTATFFSLGGFINAIYARKYDDISIIPTFVLTPLTYLGGVFYSVLILPEFWQNLSYLNPIFYLVNIFRFGFLGICDIDVITAFIGLIIVIIGLWSYCITLIKNGVGLRQ